MFEALLACLSYRSRMMASIEDVTRLVGLPYLADSTSGKGLPVLGQSGSPAKKTKSKVRASGGACLCAGLIGPSLGTWELKGKG